MKRFLIFCLVFGISFSVIASGSSGAHHGSIKDLLYPYINFFILLFFILKKTIPAAKDYFSEQALLVKELTERAAKMSQETNIKYEYFETKLKNLDKEIEKIQKNTEQEFEKFKQTYVREVEDKKSKLKSELISRLEVEKDILGNKLKNDFILSVFNKAKENISSDSNLQSKATNKLMKELKI